jgi:hypothetical protein
MHLKQFRTLAGAGAAQRTRNRTSVKAAAAAGTAVNPIGVHALVFSGDWSEAGCRKAAAGAAAAGEQGIFLYDKGAEPHRLASHTTAEGAGTPRASSHRWNYLPSKELSSKVQGVYDAVCMPAACNSFGRMYDGCFHCQTHFATQRLTVHSRPLPFTPLPPAKATTWLRSHQMQPAHPPLMVLSSCQSHHVRCVEFVQLRPGK